MTGSVLLFLIFLGVGFLGAVVLWVLYFWYMASRYPEEWWVLRLGEDFAEPRKCLDFDEAVKVATELAADGSASRIYGVYMGIIRPILNFRADPVSRRSGP